MSRQAWIRACSETRWHLTHPGNSGLALHVRCGHVVWAPVHRRLQTPPTPPEDLCEACQSAGLMMESITWPTSDPDSTTRLRALSSALDHLGLDDPPMW